MTYKAVYASLGFNIYITQDELNTLLTKGEIIGQAYIGKQQMLGSFVRVYVDPATRSILSIAHKQDQTAIDQAKASMASGYFKSVNKISKP